MRLRKFDRPGPVNSRKSAGWWWWLYYLGPNNLLEETVLFALYIFKLLFHSSIMVSNLSCFCGYSILEVFVHISGKLSHLLQLNSDLQTSLTFSLSNFRRWFWAILFILFYWITVVGCKYRSRIFSVYWTWEKGMVCWLFSVGSHEIG